jgi:bifunctional non-homologous end joining protein LigD
MPLPLRALPAGFIAPCLPTSAPQPPSGEEWLHEIKHDGFRVIARKDGGRIKLYSRPGNDLTSAARAFTWRRATMPLTCQQSSVLGDGLSIHMVGVGAPDTGTIRS